MQQDFTWTVRVYYEDTDAGGVVFYANYLKFFERARTEWLRAIGIDHLCLLRSHQVLFVVKSTQVEYHAPARLDDELKLTVAVERIGRASIQFNQQAWRVNGEQSQLLTSGQIHVVCVNHASLRPTAFPPEVLIKITE